MAFLVDRYLKDYSGIQDFKAAHPDYNNRFQAFVEQSAQTTDIEVCHKLIGDLIDYINNGHVVFSPLEENPKYEVLLEEEDGEEKDYYPTLNFINSETALLSIKTGSLEYKPDLDALINESQPKLEATNHLIIDLRGNSGGGDDTYNNIIPFLYTNPILTQGASLWASENNIALFEQYMGNPNLPEDSRQMVASLVEKGKKYPNTFVPFGESAVDTFTLAEVKLYPKKVSILIDKKCTSATEEFLLKAKQSNKTTIYGYESSGGALDYSNLNPVITPSGYWYVTIPTTRSNRLPDNPVDPDGIAPDVLVDKKVEDLIEWVINNAK